MQNSRAAFEERSVIQAISDTLRSEFRRDERVIIMGEDVGARGGVFRVTEGFLDEFGPERVIDTPLAESCIVGVALGAAVGGLVTIAEIQFADFSAAAFEQIVNEAARIRYRSNGAFGVSMVVRMPWGGGVRGALYHSQSLEAFYAHVPGLKVVVPSSPRDAAGLLRAAIRDPDPIIFLEHKATYRLLRGPVPQDPDFVVPIGTAEVKRQGSDVSVFAYGLMQHYSMLAAELLDRESGLSVEVVDVRSLRPLDADTILSSARRTGKCLVVYEDNRMYGAGAEIAALIADEAFDRLDAPVRRLGGPESPAVPFAQVLEDTFMLSPAKIASAVRDLAAY